MFILKKNYLADYPNNNAEFRFFRKKNWFLIFLEKEKRFLPKRIYSKETL